MVLDIEEQHGRDDLSQSVVQSIQKRVDATAADRRCAVVSLHRDAHRDSS
jgi:hypothetical protein